MDSENWNQGKVIPGQWQSLSNDGLIDVSTPHSSNNHTRNTAAVHDFYANMFVMTDIVPWQWNMLWLIFFIHAKCISNKRSV
jgi:hypothetical protein